LLILQKYINSSTNLGFLRIEIKTKAKTKIQKTLVEKTAMNLPKRQNSILTSNLFIQTYFTKTYDFCAKFAKNENIKFTVSQTNNGTTIRRFLEFVTIFYKFSQANWLGCVTDTASVLKQKFFNAKITLNGICLP
jgi:hypothetical protein